MCILLGISSPGRRPGNQIRALAFSLINDLVTENARLRKYVDNTKASIISETVAKGELSNAQRITDRVIKRSPQSRVQLNDRCKKNAILSFTKSQQEFEPILINVDALDMIGSVKLLGFDISSDLPWNIRINVTIKKAPMGLYYLLQLKGAKFACTDLRLF